MAKTGRPSKYKQEYCDMLTDHMKSGLSFETFAAVIHVNQDTLHEWAKVHKEFSEAKKTAFNYCKLFWEKLGISGAAGKLSGFNAASYIFNMKNRFKWRDRHEVDLNVLPKPIIIEKLDGTKEELGFEKK